MKEKDSMRPTEPMKNPLGSSYPVDVLAQLESDKASRRVFNAMPREIQLDILQHNTMTPLGTSWRPTSPDPPLSLSCWGKTPTAGPTSAPLPPR